MLDGNHLSEGACYSNKHGRDMAILTLCKSAHKLFSETSVIQNLDELKACPKDPPDSLNALTKIVPRLELAYLDTFRIVAAFENFFKAQLIKFGYVVHIVDRSIDKKLSKDQKSIPVRLSSIKKLNQEPWRRGGSFRITALKNTTISFSQMINPKSGYVRSLRLSAYSLEVLKRVNLKRNTTHLLSNNISEYGDDIVQGYQHLKDLVNTRLVPFHMHILTAWPSISKTSAWQLNEI